MFCNHCGKQIPNTCRFCAYCGHPTGSLPDPQQRSYQRPPNAQNPRGYTPQGYTPNGRPPQGYAPNRRPPQGYAPNGRPPQGYIPNGRPPQGYTPNGRPPQGYAPPPRVPGIGQAAARTAQNAGMYKMLSILAAFAVLAILLTVLLYNLFIKSGKPEDTIADLEKAMNNLDTEAMLDCFDEQTQKLYSGSLGVAGSLLGMDLGAFSDLAAGLGGIMAGAGLTPEVTMHITDIEYSDKETCIVTVDMSVSYGGGTESETVQLPMKKIGRKWLISLQDLDDFIYN